MKICLSPAVSTVVGMRNLFRRVSKVTDMVEIRLDRMHNPSLSALLRRPRPTVVVTNRSAEEGGHFKGSAEEQFALLAQACQLGAEFVDVEMRWGPKFYRDLVKQFPTVNFILSHHNFEHTLHNLLAVYRAMRRLKPAVMKIATMANSIGDNAIMFSVLEQAANDEQKLIGLCMGEYGQVSRIMGARFDSFLTFAALRPDSTTAPGQVDLDALTNLYRVHKLRKDTKIFGLVGNPVSHSQGIFYHNEIFRRRKLDAVYLNFLSEAFEGFMKAFGQTVSGISITMPFKQDCLPFVTRWGDGSTEIGAVNTMIVNRNHAVGYNTDLTALQQLLKSRKRIAATKAVIIGTGGLARTMAYAAIREGLHTTIAGRTRAKAAALANALGCDSVSIDEISYLPCDILMNGSSVGMHPGVDPELVPKSFLHKNMLVVDGVYTPEHTTLIKRAEAAGCKTIKGGEIFRRQASLQSRLFIKALS
jgi:3-dehydroquinate dehydratase/shikimate dehydrogenase